MPHVKYLVIGRDGRFHWKKPILLGFGAPKVKSGMVDLYRGRYAVVSDRAHTFGDDPTPVYIFREGDPEPVPLFEELVAGGWEYRHPDIVDAALSDREAAETQLNDLPIWYSISVVAILTAIVAIGAMVWRIFNVG